MSDTKDEHNARLARDITARMRQLTGRAYPRLELDLKKLSSEALVDLARFASDVQSEVTRVKAAAIREPWRSRS